jgi:hypothetical protein
MRTPIYALLAIGFSFGVRPLPARAQAPDSTYLARGRSVYAMFTNDELGQLWEQFGPEMHAMAVSVPRFEQFRKTILGRFGKETELLHESVEHEDSLIVYVRESRFEKVDSPVRVTWSFHPDGKVAKFGFQMAGAQP